MNTDGEARAVFDGYINPNRQAGGRWYDSLLHGEQLDVIAETGMVGKHFVCHENDIGWPGHVAAYTWAGSCTTDSMLHM